MLPGPHDLLLGLLLVTFRAWWPPRPNCAEQNSGAQYPDCRRRRCVTGQVATSVAAIGRHVPTDIEQEIFVTLRYFCNYPDD
jgi:hypothetical protein